MLDYQSSWKNYSYTQEQERFVSDDYMKRICCQKLNILNGKIETNDQEKYYGSGGVPVLQEEGVFYVLDGHCAVEGETGSKKSRCITKPSIITSGIAGQSMVVLDPKGEIINDTSIIAFLKECAYEIIVLDFREFNQHGWNFMAYPYRKIKEGEKKEAETYINRFCNSLLADIKENDSYWNDQAVLVINAWLIILLNILADKKENCGDMYANLAALLNFMNKDRAYMLKLLEELDRECDYEYRQQISVLQAYYQLPEKTYGCVYSSIITLLKDFCIHQNLSKMLCVDSFEVKDLYKKSIVVFMVVPDESAAFDHIAGLIVDSIYEQLITEYAKTYHGRKVIHAVHFILDEFASLQINDMAQKISAARSRKIIFTLLYQSESQLESVYGVNGAKTILGNIKNHIFMGSSSQEALERISRAAGKTYFKENICGELLIRPEDLRKMKKTDIYKDALVMRENILYTPRLYDVEHGICGKILDNYKKENVFYSNQMEDKKVYAYTPEQLYFDLVHSNG